MWWGRAGAVRTHIDQLQRGRGPATQQAPTARLRSVTAPSFGAAAAKHSGQAQQDEASRAYLPPEGSWMALAESTAALACLAAACEAWPTA